MSNQTFSIRNSRIGLIRLLLIVVGGLAGYAYYYFIGCVNGICPIMASPWMSILYGALIGWLIFFTFSKKNKVSSSDSSQSKLM